MPSYRTAIFDLDGTLVDSLKDIHVALTATLESFALPTFDIDTTRGYVGDGFTMLLKRATGESYTKDIELDFKRRYFAALTVHSKPYDGVMAMLARASKLCDSLVVLSNKAEAPTRAIVKHFGIDAYVEAAYGGDSFAEKKPSPLPVRRILASIDASPDTAIMIGDNHTDIEAGHAAGIHTCFCRYGYGTLSGVAPVHSVESPADILDVLRGSQ